MGASGWTHIEVKIILLETAKAFLCRLEDDKDYWLPKSVVADPEDYEAGETELELSVKDWFVDKMEPAEKKSVFDQKARGETDE